MDVRRVIAIAALGTSVALMRGDSGPRVAAAGELSPSPADAHGISTMPADTTLPNDSTRKSSARSARTPTQIEMRNVDFWVGEGVVLHIHRLRGSMRSHSDGPVLFDDPSSFTIRLVSAEVGMTGADLTTLLSKHVFAYPGAPLKNLEVRIENGQLVQTGKLHKGVWLSFKIQATVDVTPDGRIRIHPVHTKIMGLNGGAIMKAIGLHLSNVLNLSGSKGAVVDRNDIVIDPARALPPPAVEGQLVGVRIEGDQMIQTFGKDPATIPALPVPDRNARNYMFYRGGSLRFGKLVMLDADMQIVDLDPSDPFEFNLARYINQLVPGYSKTLPDLGLEVFMKDINDVGDARTTARSAERTTKPTAASGRER
ncbi:MAG: hypothetical protein ABIT38_03975 [Gemmatimonadaceae bacterium]